MGLQRVRHDLAIKPPMNKYDGKGVCVWRVVSVEEDWARAEKRKPWGVWVIAEEGER